MMLDYFAAFARSGNPNGYDRPKWKPCHDGKTEILHIEQDRIAMGKVFLPKLLFNMISKGNPKA
jgi:carboxylesterase type B